MLDLEALWSAKFSTNMGSWGAGVIVLETLRAFGGDNAYYYIGDYKAENGIVEANITATHYHGAPNSIIGPVKQFTVKLSGKHTEPVFNLEGFINNNPQMKISVELTKIALLP